MTSQKRTQRTLQLISRQMGHSITNKGIIKTLIATVRHGDRLSFARERFHSFLADDEIYVDVETEPHRGIPGMLEPDHDLVKPGFREQFQALLPLLDDFKDAFR